MSKNSNIFDQLPQTKYGSQETWTTGKVRFEMFPEGYQALAKELACGMHPKLAAQLTQPSANDPDIQLSLIAAYCGVVLDGVYSLEERDKLCFILVGRLQVLRELPAPTIIQEVSGGRQLSD